MQSVMVEVLDYPVCKGNNVAHCLVCNGRNKVVQCSRAIDFYYANGFKNLDTILLKKI